MKLVIDIPEKDIPKNLGTIDINLSFCNGTVCQCNYPFETDIEQMPSVSTEKTGRWFIDERPESDREVVCSNCNQPIFKYHKLDFDYRPKYCPNCGAKMVEPHESEE